MFEFLLEKRDVLSGSESRTHIMLQRIDHGPRFSAGTSMLTKASYSANSKLMTVVRHYGTRRTRHPPLISAGSLQKQAMAVRPSTITSQD
jgi:hypothetical protein